MYNPYLDTGRPTDVVKELNETFHQVGQVYWMTPQKNPVYYNRYCQMALANKDTAGLQKVLNYFIDGRGKAGIKFNGAPTPVG